MILGNIVVQVMRKTFKLNAVVASSDDDDLPPVLWDSSLQTTSQIPSNDANETESVIVRHA